MDNLLIRRLLKLLQERQGDEIGSLHAVCLWLWHVELHGGEFEGSGKTLDALYARLKRAEHKKKFGNRSRDPLKTEALAWAAADVYRLRHSKKCTEKKALEKVSKTYRLSAKEIENFIDELQRGRPKYGAEIYEELTGIKPRAHVK